MRGPRADSDRLTQGNREVRCLGGWVLVQVVVAGFRGDPGDGRRSIAGMAPGSGQSQDLGKHHVEGDSFHVLRETLRVEWIVCDLCGTPGEICRGAHDWGPFRPGPPWYPSLRASMQAPYRTTRGGRWATPIGDTGSGLRSPRLRPEPRALG